MLTVNELTSYLDQYLQVDAFKDYCPNGMQVEGKQEIHKLGFAVSATLDTLEEALANNCDALVVHHGLFWKGDSYVIERSLKRKLKLLLNHDLTLFAYHLPLDAHQTVGNNFAAAKELGWKDLKPFQVYGVQGTFDAMPIEGFVKSLESFYGHSAHVALGGKEHVSSAALVSGGGYKFLKEAACSQVDCFITGNFDEPAWGLAFEEKIHFVALGHSATEKIGVQKLQKHLSEKFTLETQFLDLFNPF